MRRFFIAMLLGMTAMSAASAAETWTVVSALEPGDVGSYNDVAVDHKGNLHISFINVALQRLEYARRDAASGQWTYEIVDQDANRTWRGLYSRISLKEPTDGDVTAYIAYQVVTVTAVGLSFQSVGQLRVAERPQAGDGYAQNSLPWGYRNVTTTNDNGYDVSMAMDAAFNLHLAWYDRTGGRLMYRTGAYADIDSVSNPAEIVDNGGGSANVGRGCAIALDSLGYPHIAYYDTTNSHLKHAYKDAASAGSWNAPAVISSSAVAAVIDSVDLGKMTFSPVAMAFVTSGTMDVDRMHVVYYHDLSGPGPLTQSSLNEGAAWYLHAPKGTGDWSSAVGPNIIGSETYAGLYSRMTVNTDLATPELWICFWKFPGGSTLSQTGMGLRVFRRPVGGSSWAQEDVDTHDTRGQFCSMTYGGPALSRYLYITYQDLVGADGNRDLKLASNDPTITGGTTAPPVDTSGGCGMGTGAGGMAFLAVGAVGVAAVMRRRRGEG
jgi:hypothetical protein